MSKLFIVVALVIALSANAFMPARTAASERMEMSMSMDIRKALGVVALGFSLAGPMPAMADGAVSASTIYRARNYYGGRILDLAEAADKGNFAAFEDKKSKNGFDLFISGSNRRNNEASKELKSTEEKIKNDLYAAVNAKDAGKLKAAYKEFINAADLKSDYQPGELGQTGKCIQ